ncbi:hypothetical protein DL96DRAFT_1609371 [Flagelloscypha sp. PMI_526]|nr:hypothetical protein DL96DRAFT_1609371 [Flagelloscypha sp. PMI_526]
MCFENSVGEKYYALWNPVSGSCATWTADKNDTSTDQVEIIVSDFIIAVDSTSQAMVVYSLPEIPARSSYAPGVSAKLCNPALLCIPVEPDLQNRRKMSRMYWQTYPKRGRLLSNHYGFASIYDAGEDEWLLEHVEIYRTESSSSAFTPLPLECKRSYSQYPHFLPISEGWSGTADILLDQSLLLHGTSQERTQVVFHLSSLHEGTSAREIGRGILYDSGGAFEISRPSYSLSPFAGRMCIATSNGIEVIDFVELPYLPRVPTA